MIQKVEYHTTLSLDYDVTKEELNKLIGELLHPHFKVDAGYILLGIFLHVLSGTESLADHSLSFLNTTY